MEKMKRRPGLTPRTGASDQAGSKVGTDGSRPIPLPVSSLSVALDWLDSQDLCSCWVAPRRRRCRRRSR